MLWWRQVSVKTRHSAPNSPALIPTIFLSSIRRWWMVKKIPWAVIASKSTALNPKRALSSPMLTNVFLPCSMCYSQWQDAVYKCWSLMDFYYNYFKWCTNTWKNDSKGFLLLLLLCGRRRLNGIRKRCHTVHIVKPSEAMWFVIWGYLPQTKLTWLRTKPAWFMDNEAVHPERAVCKTPCISFSRWKIFSSGGTLLYCH